MLDLRVLCGVSVVVCGACARHPATVAGDAGGSEASATAANEPRHPDGGIETECNGKDDDGDGLIDVLLPTGANGCRTSLPGACATGFAMCQGGKRVCVAPPPMPEVADGIDNDCNGKVDDVPDTSVHPRALVLAPRYAWSDAASDIATVSSVLAQAGIPYDVQPAGTDWDKAIPTLGQYALAIVPGYLEGDAVRVDERNALEQFASRGGVVVVFKPVGPAEFPQAWLLAGLRSSEKHKDELDIRFDGTRPPAVASMDSPEELTIHINDPTTADRPEAYALDPDPAEKVEVVAHGVSVDASWPVITRRSLGTGAIYAIGHDLTTFGASRCYVNCFEPAGDILRLFLEGALRESASGHVVLKHTVPGEASSALIVTHDVDANEAENEGPWGPPGALQSAEIERARGVRATYNITTDYVTGYYNEQTLRDLCDVGMCPLGAHSVTHPAGLGELPDGTCAEKRPTYGAKKTLCGEVRVSRDLIAQATGHPPRVWRSPYLGTSPKLFALLAKSGFAFDSSYGIGDLPYNLPVDLAAVGFHQERFAHARLLEFPVSCEDGIVEKGEAAAHRVELQASTRARFGDLWRYVLLRNAQNRAVTTLLLHPSRGRGMASDNLEVKLEALASLLDDVKGYDAVVRPMEEMGDFWRARLDSSLDGSYEGGTGYTGTLTIGATTAPGLTLEFGDAVASFTCAACGETRIHGKRVTIVGALPPKTKASFAASVR